MDNAVYRLDNCLPSLLSWLHCPRAGRDARLYTSTVKNRWFWIGVGAVLGLAVGIALVAFTGTEGIAALSPVLSGAIGAGSALLATQLSARREAQTRREAREDAERQADREAERIGKEKGLAAAQAALAALVRITALGRRVRDEEVSQDEINSQVLKAIHALDTAALESGSEELQKFPALFEATLTGGTVWVNVDWYLDPNRLHNLVTSYREAARALAPWGIPSAEVTSAATDAS
jgi:hypothetical protein